MPTTRDYFIPGSTFRSFLDVLSKFPLVCNFNLAGSSISSACNVIQCMADAGLRMQLFSLNPKLSASSAVF